MKKLVSLSLLSLLFLMACGQGPVWFTGTLDEAMMEAEKGGKDVLIYAWSRT